MTTQKMINNWLDILNDISAYIEQFVMNEEDKDRIHKLDKVIDELYTFMKVLPLVENKKD